MGLTRLDKFASKGGEFLSIKKNMAPGVATALLSEWTSSRRRQNEASRVVSPESVYIYLKVYGYTSMISP